MFHARTVEMPVNMIDIVFNNRQFKAQLLIVVFVLFSITSIICIYPSFCRFYFEGLQSAKVTSPVNFELNKFNLDLVCSTEALAKDSCIFDLTGIVCHKGSTFRVPYISFVCY